MPRCRWLWSWLDKNTIPRNLVAFYGKSMLQRVMQDDVEMHRHPVCYDHARIIDQREEDRNGHLQEQSFAKMNSAKISREISEISYYAYLWICSVVSILFFFFSVGDADTSANYFIDATVFSPDSDLIWLDWIQKRVRNLISKFRSAAFVAWNRCCFTIDRDCRMRIIGAISWRDNERW